MFIDVTRYHTGDDYTLGVMHIDGKLAAYTLEDGVNVPKVEYKTRIPAGVYHVALRTNSPKSQDYAARFPDMHKGMIWLRGVPGFEWVYVHIGNTNKDTAGCILIADGPMNAWDIVNGEPGFIGSSKNAYTRIYPKIAQAITSSNPVLCRVVTLA